MATAVANPPPVPSPSLSAQKSPDTVSPVYPERIIRPLPRSRLASKLSPQQASSIIYPPDPPPISPSLGLAEKEAAGNHQNRMPNGTVGHDQYLQHPPHRHHDTPIHTHCTCEEEADSGDEEIEFDHPDLRYATPTANGHADSVLDNVQRRLLEAARTSSKAAPPHSASSSADGYESFENTSNKKKRKIPLSAASSMHQTQLSAEMASMGLGGPLDGALDDVHGGRDGLVGAKGEYYPSPPSSGTLTGTGISGAGRGRYGRQSVRSDHGVRRPLATSSLNSLNGYNPRPFAKNGGEVRSLHADAEIENTGGIISQAIKSAAEQGPITPQKGQELASLLQTATSNYSTPANSKTQFTFSVESESANKMLDQQAAAAAAAAQAAYATQTGNARGANSQAVQGGNRGGPASGGQAVAGARQPNGTQPGGSSFRQPSTAAQTAPQPAAQAPPPPKPKPRRRPSKEYAIAARQRRLNQEYTNYHHRPTKDNMWICEFCEYEAIFGTPPEALIRQYEVKDRQERKRQAEKRRLLEKAKAKNRKGKKGSKKGGGGGNNNAATAAASAHPANGQQQPYDPDLLPPDGEEYYDDDEYGDEYEPIGPDDQYPMDYNPPPVPTGTPLDQRGKHGG